MKKLQRLLLLSLSLSPEVKRVKFTQERLEGMPLYTLGRNVRSVGHQFDGGVLTVRDPLHYSHLGRAGSGVEMSRIEKER